MKKMIIAVCSVMLVLLLTGCQHLNQGRAKYIRDREQDYLVSTIIAPLRVPDDLAQPAGTESYPLPEQLPPSGSVAKVSMVPPGFGQLS